MKIVSACFAGLHCRYDQGHNALEEICRLVREGKAVPVCPEQAGGLPTPRNPAEIVGGDGNDIRWIPKRKENQRASFYLPRLRMNYLAMAAIPLRIRASQILCILVALLRSMKM